MSRPAGAHGTRGEMRLSRLREEIGGVSQKMLTKTLRQLERYGLASRYVHPVIAPRVDYQLTPLGRSLLDKICGIWDWVEHVIYNALKRADSTARIRVLAAMPSTQYDGVIGRIVFDPHGDLNDAAITIYKSHSTGNMSAFSLCTVRSRHIGCFVASPVCLIGRV